MTEKTTGQRLMELRERSGLTLAEVAKKAGYKGPSSVQAMFNPDYNVKPLGMAVGDKLWRAFEGTGDPPITYEEIWRLCSVSGQAGEIFPGGPFVRTLGVSGMEMVPVREVDPGPTALPTLRGQPKDIPVYGTALAADLDFDDNGHPAPVEQTLFEMGEIITYARRPPAIPQESKVYALYVAGSSMEPRYRPGAAIFVDPRKPPAIGDDVVVQLVSTDDEPQIIAGLIKTLVKRTGSYLELEQYQPEIRFRVPMDRVAHIHRVIPANELFGI